MTGVKFVVDDKGRRTAVQLDLDKWGELWEDLYDSLIAASRATESRTSWSKVKDELLSETADE